MSALLPKYGPLPAAMMALTFATVAPAAKATEPAAGLYETSSSHRIALRSFAEDGRTGQLLGWIERAKAAFAAAHAANDSLTSLVALRLSEAKTGLSALTAWSVHTTGMNFAAAAAVSKTLADAAIDPALSEATRDGLLVSLAAAQNGIRQTRMAMEGRVSATGHRLSSFALADFGAPREMRRTLVTQRGLAPTPAPATASAGLYQSFGAVLDIEAEMRQATSWSALFAAADKAAHTLRAETAPEAAAWADNLRVVAERVQSLSQDSLEMVGVAKAAFVRIIGEAANISASALPARKSASMTTEASQVTPANTIDGAIRTFGRKIDYLGFAHRWVIGAP